MLRQKCHPFVTIYLSLNQGLQQVPKWQLMANAFLCIKDWFKLWKSWFPVSQQIQKNFQFIFCWFSVVQRFNGFDISTIGFFMVIVILCIVYVSLLLTQKETQITNIWPKTAGDPEQQCKSIKNRAQQNSGLCVYNIISTTE